MKSSITALKDVLGFALATLFVSSIGTAQAPSSSDDAPEGLDSADWSGIRKEYETHRHDAYPVAGDYEANNPGQQWRTRFDGQGFTTRPNAGGWTWGLELVRYGFVGEERDVAQPTRMNTEGQHVIYDWDATLEEWYINDGRGLEHGYTVYERPPYCDEPGLLTFTLAVRGELRPEVLSDGRGVRFLNEDGAAVITYSGLTVFDADGQLLRAQFESVSEGLLLTVDERDARYPLTIDPIAQQAYLKASNTDINDQFGGSVAVSGNTVVVGARFEDSDATGVNGNQDNMSAGANSGAVYVFVRNGTTWSQQAYLKASNTDPLDEFGGAVAVAGDTIVVGAPNESSNATGVDGDQSDNSSAGSGAAYVFVRLDREWRQRAYLKASNTDPADGFGSSVAVSGGTVVIGAWPEDSNATGLNGDQSDNSANFAGAAYVFVNSETGWSQQAYLKASNNEKDDNFGVSVAASGDTVVVGARGEDSFITGINGIQSNNGSPASGAAYVFVRSGSTWSQQAYLKPSNTDPGDTFGESVAVSGDTVVVGAFREDSRGTGVSGGQSNHPAGLDSGAAYIFVRNGTTWSQQAYLKASNTDALDAFGVSVAVSGDTVVVGAHNEDSNATGVDGDQSNNSAQIAGAAYVFARTGTAWRHQAYLKASNADSFNAFGNSVAVSGDIQVVGAFFEDGSATGVNGDQRGSGLSRPGAAYIFETPCPQIVASSEVVRLGMPPNPAALLPGLTSGPVVGATWDPVIDHSTFLPDADRDLLLISPSPVNVYLGLQGTLLCNYGQVIARFNSDPGVPFSIPVPNNCTLIGVEFCSQGVSFVGEIFRLTNALDITVGTF